MKTEPVLTEKLATKLPDLCLGVFHDIIHNLAEHVVHDREKSGEKTEDEEEDGDHVFADRVGGVVLSESFLRFGGVYKELCRTVSHIGRLYAHST